MNDTPRLQSLKEMRDAIRNKRDVYSRGLIAVKLELIRKHYGEAARDEAIRDLALEDFGYLLARR